MDVFVGPDGETRVKNLESGARDGRHLLRLRYHPHYQFPKIHLRYQEIFLKAPLFSFVSFTTVGFGDTLPVTDGVGRLCFTLLYLTWGIMLTTALFGVLNQYLRKVATFQVFEY